METAENPFAGKTPAEQEEIWQKIIDNIRRSGGKGIPRAEAIARMTGQRGPKPTPNPDGRHLLAEWDHLRRWLDALLPDAEPRIKSFNMADVGRRTGIGQLFGHWYHQTPHRGKPREVLPVHHLDNAQRFFAAFGYEPPTNFHKLL